MVVVAGRSDQYTESNKRVEEGCARFMMNGAESKVSSSNIMASLIETTNLSHSTFKRE